MSINSTKSKSKFRKVLDFKRFFRYFLSISTTKHATLTNVNKKSIIRGRALSFNKVFVTVSTAMRGLHKDCTKVSRRILRRMLSYFKFFFNWRSEMRTNLNQKNRGRFATACKLAIAAGILAIVAACGGGGSSTPPPVTTPAPTITAALTAEKCDVQSGNGFCTVTESFSTANATSVTLTDAAGKVLSAKTSDTIIVNVLLGANSYTLTATGAGGTVSKTLTATGSCATGSAPSGTTCVGQVQAVLTATPSVWVGGKATLTWSWTGGKPDSCVTSGNWSNSNNLTGSGLSDALTVDTTFTYACTNGNGTTTASATVKVSCPVAGQMVVNGVCTDPVLSYPATVYLLWTGGYPYVVTGTDVIPVKNMTKYTSGFWPLSLCWIMDPSFLSQTKGKVLTNCQDATGGGRHDLYIDPTNNGLYEFTGTVPANIIWHAVTPIDAVLQQPSWASQAETPDEWFYTLKAANWVLYSLNKKTGVSTIKKAGTLAKDGNIDYMNSYTMN